MRKAKTPGPVEIKRIAALIAIFLIIAALLPPCAAAFAGEMPGGAGKEAKKSAPEGAKTVRVGWYDSSYNTVDSSGRRTGYAYEYQLKIASYTGWRYEYVSGSWPDLMDMLYKGDIDLMSDVSYTAERAEKILYPELAMGTEEYYLFTSPANTSLDPSDLSTLNGKKIGVNKDSVQETFLREWAVKNGVTLDITELTTTEDESLYMTETGELDGYVTVDSFTDPEKTKPICKVGYSDFYFAVSGSRRDLLAELNSALTKIREENRYYNQEMFERFVNTSGSNSFLTNDELSWLSSHGKIRVGYQDGYLAFCASDPSTGELTGALKDYLESLSTCLANAGLEFETRPFKTVNDAIKALKKGEIDCVFPANLSGYDGEQLGIVMSRRITSTDIYAVIRRGDVSEFARKEHVIVAVNDGNPNYDAFLVENFPEWRTVYYKTTSDCLKAVSERVADCVLVSSYRYNNVSRLCDKYNLTSFPTGASTDYCFATSESQIELHSILSKAVGQIPESRVNASLSRYITEDAKQTLSDYLSDNLAAVLLIAAAVALIILFLLIRSVKTENKSKRLIKATETDALTGLYNRDYFFEYAGRMRKEKPDEKMDAIVINIEQFHSINALHGREFGDLILKVLGNEIKLIADESGGIGGRFGADSFDIYRRSSDDYRTVYDRLQNKLNGLSGNASVRLRMGISPYSEGLDPVQLFDRARTACSMARGHYKEHLIIFNEAVRDHEIRDQRLLSDFHKALESYEFEVWYQPKFDIQSDPPRLASAEALVRWQHSELGMIPPDEFITLFERSGKIGELDRFVWSEAARQTSRWKTQFGIDLPVSVNISRVDLLDPTLKSTLDAVIEENGIGREMLLLEVTESAYTENADQAALAVESLRAAGYTVEMDDFGTGYSSLNMLSAMPIDVLKMDRTFVSDIEHSEKDVQLVALILGIAKSLNIPVVAEGVETDSQLQMLRDLGCPIVQGYYFARPLHPTDFEKEFLLAASKTQL